MSERKMDAIDAIKQEISNMRKIGEKQLDIGAIKRHIDNWGRGMQYCTNVTCRRAWFCKRSVVHTFSKSCFYTPDSRTGECGFFISQIQKKKKAEGEK